LITFVINLNLKKIFYLLPL